MNFENLNQLIASLQMLLRFYSVVRISDGETKKILYDSEYSMLANGIPISFSGCYDASFSINEKDSTLSPTITIPVSIAKHLCYLQLIQCDDEIKSTPVMQEFMFQHIQKLLITDSLTNVYNRRYIDTQLPVDLNQAFQNSKPVSLIYIDIDYFKNINDKYGHIAGDSLLKEVAIIFRHHIQKSKGWLARYGGDEFLICLPEICQSTAVKIANKIRIAVESSDFCVNSHHIKITCSLGMQTVYKENGVNTVDNIIKLVDKKLYHAKKHGRNKIGL